MAYQRTIFHFASGYLRVDAYEDEWSMDDLCRFAERENPKRRYLIISTVLGRHKEVAPSEMRRSAAALAAKVPGDLPGPVLVIGMAETAICLGQTIHEELLLRTGRDDVWTIHSTRQVIDHPILLEFKEPHSHAARHIVYVPEEMFALQGQPRSIVIVDDEVSTGTTVTNLSNQLLEKLPTVEKIVIASLTDWTRGMDWTDEIRVPTHKVCLLDGDIAWLDHAPKVRDPRNRPDIANDNGPMEVDALGSIAEHRNFGRTGRRDIVSDGDHLIAKLKIAPGQKLRVLGTCEFTYPAFRIAELLEKRGHDVVVQATTRSPIKTNAHLKFKMKLDDNYSTPAPNYIYNIDFENNDRVTIICHETPEDSVDLYLSALLDAQMLNFGAID